MGMRKFVLSAVTAILFLPIPVFAARPQWQPDWFFVQIFGVTVSVWLLAFAMLAMVAITRVEVAPTADGK
jgi:hypothetical protein